MVCYGSDGMRLYWEVARRALQRQLAYRTENLAGLVTNIFFGYLRAAVLLAVYQATSSVGGYDAEAAVTYAWITQAMIMLVALWGWWDVELTIRTGDVISDLAKPFWRNWDRLASSQLLMYFSTCSSWSVLVWCCQAVSSAFSGSRSPIRRSRHCRVRADSSISAMLSQEPCLGV